MQKASSAPAERVRSEAGLTLVEVAVVLFILGMALALAAPAMPRPRSGADAAAHALARTLARCRLAAAREGIRVDVVVDATTGEYRVHAPAGSGGDSLLARGRLSADSAVRVVPAHGGTRAVFRFGALGRADGGPVRVEDAEDRGYVVFVNRWTGRVRVEIE